LHFGKQPFSYDIQHFTNGKYGSTALMLSIEYKIGRRIEDNSLIRMIIDAGADLDLQNDDGETALMISVLMAQM